MTAALEVHDVTVHYGEVLALDRVSLRVEPGGVCGLIGMNGSGKSTLLKTIIGLVRPDRGRVLIGGLAPSAARKLGSVAYVPQSESVDWNFPVSVHEAVMMGRFGHQGTTRRVRPADESAVRDALERVELTDLAGRQIGQLSGGQRRRVFVARGIAQGADLMLLDEPFAGVDRRSEATVVRLLRELANEGRTILIASHDLNALPQLADESILLMRSVLMHGPTAEVLRPENLARAFGLDAPPRREDDE